MRILVVEDDKILSMGIRQGLSQLGFSVDDVANLESARSALKTQEYALIVLDLGLPDGDGRTFIQQIRTQKISTPLLVLTAKDSTFDKIQTLDYGADDYMIKPFDINELAARIRALTRRSQGRTAPLLQYKNLILDPATHQLLKDNQPIELSGREFSILKLLLEQKGKVLTRERIEEQLYSWGQEIESNTVEVHIHHLRKKIGIEFIKNIRGVGYLIP